MMRRAHRFCACCGVPQRLTRVVVQPLRAEVPDVGALDLCPGCLQRSGRTWRLGYRISGTRASATLAV